MHSIPTEPVLKQLAEAIAGVEAFDERVARLQQLGLAETEAERWADLMPLAFARAAYRFQYGGPYPQDKQRDIQGRPPFSDDEVYQQAMIWACDCGAMDAIDPEVFNRIVRLSPECDFIRSSAGYR